MSHYIQPGQVILFKDEAEAKLFLSIHRDRKFTTSFKPHYRGAWSLKYDNVISFCHDLTFLGDYTEYKLPKCAEIPEGYRLLDDYSEGPHPQAMVFDSELKEWRLRVREPGRSCLNYFERSYYIVPIEPPANAEDKQEGELATVDSPKSVVEKEEKMLSEKEKQDILEIIALHQKATGNAGPGIAVKTLGFAGRSARRALRWAIAPAKPIGWVTAKLIQYTLFAGLIGSAGAGTYWAWNNAKDYMPTIQWNKPATKEVQEVTEVDAESAKIAKFVMTGVYQ